MMTSATARSSARELNRPWPRGFGVRAAARAGFHLVGIALEEAAVHLVDRVPRLRVRIRGGPSTPCPRSSGSGLCRSAEILESFPPRAGAEDMRHHYRTVALAKTGTLFRFACQLGADLSRCDTNERSALLEYADHLALAFQIVDDIRDIEGAADLGKAAGTDAAGHVLSWPVIEWLAESSEACDQWDELGRSRQGPADLAALRAEIGRSGATARARTEATRLTQMAAAALQPFAPSAAVTHLEELCECAAAVQPSARREAAGGRPSAGRAAPATANGADCGGVRSPDEFATRALVPAARNLGVAIALLPRPRGWRRTPPSSPAAHSDAFEDPWRRLGAADRGDRRRRRVLGRAGIRWRRRPPGLSPRVPSDQVDLVLAERILDVRAPADRAASSRRRGVGSRPGRGRPAAADGHAPPGAASRRAYGGDVLGRCVEHACEVVAGPEVAAPERLPGRRPTRPGRERPPR